MFKPLPSVPDHPALEREVLERWEDEQTFQRLREQNAGGPRFSFIDGPITANNPMGVHHAWGRTLKDVFQRYHAGHGPRRALPERLRLPGPLGRGRGREGARPQLEARDRGLRDRRVRGALQGARRALRRRDDGAVEAPRPVDGLGQRLPHVLGHEHRVHLALPEGVPRAAAGSTRATARRSGARAAAPRSRSTSRPARRTTASSSTRRSTSASRSADRDGESLVVWTTTPWTLPGERRRRREAGRRVRAARRRLAARRGGRRVRQRPPGRGPRRARVPRALRRPARPGRRHRTASSPGTRSRSTKAPGSSTSRRARAPRTSSSRACTACRCWRRSTSPAASCPATGRSRGSRPTARRRRSSRRSTSAACSSRPARSSTATRSAGAARRRSSSASSTTGSSRLDELRQPLLDANDEVAWTPPQYKKRMDDWLRNMGDWNISRKRYFGLPLPFYPCECGELNVIGSRAELEERATGGLEQLQELHRPWIDEVADPLRVVRRGGAPHPGGRRRVARRGHRPALDARLAEPRADPARVRAPARRTGLTGADLPDHAYWEQWFPADWVSESREQIRLWFYSISVMSMTMPGRLPYRAVLDLRARARRDRPRDAQVDRQRDRGERGLRADGRRHRALAVLRAEPEPEHQLRLRARGRGQAAAADALELGRASSSRTRTSPAGSRSGGPSRRREHALDRWLVARTGQLVAEAEAAYERYWTPGGDDRLRELRRGSLELVHPPLAPALLGRRARGARDALVVARPGAARGRAGDAVPRRPSLARARGGGAGLGPPRRLARGGAAGRGAARRDGGGAPRGRARPPGARAVRDQAPPAAAAARRAGRGRPRRRRRARSPRS